MNSQILDITPHTIAIKNKEKIQRFQLKNNSYQLVQNSSVSFSTPKNIAILYIATGRYICFWKDFYSSMQKFFLPKHKKTYFLFPEYVITESHIYDAFREFPYPKMILIAKNKRGGRNYLRGITNKTHS